MRNGWSVRIRVTISGSVSVPFPYCGYITPIDVDRSPAAVVESARSSRSSSNPTSAVPVPTTRNCDAVGIRDQAVGLAGVDALIEVHVLFGVGQAVAVGVDDRGGLGIADRV